MKKIFALLMVVCLAFALASCKPDEKCTDHVDDDTNGVCDKCGADVEPLPECTEHVDENYDGVCDNEGCGTSVDVEVMTYAEFDAAALESFVVIDAYVQAHQSWWENKVTVYLADEDGAYFAYEMACSEEDAARLTTGTKVRVYGYKKNWEGVIEIMNGGINILGGDTYVAEAVDVTDKLGSEAILPHRNQLVKFTDMTVTDISYKNGEPGDDIYLTLSKNGVEYSFCIEVYLTGTDTDVYRTITTGSVSVGDVIDVEAFLYWWSSEHDFNDYTKINPHVVSIDNINE